MRRWLWPVVVGALACGYALLAFDWPAVGRALHRFDTGRFVAIGVPCTVVLLVARSVRWVAVAGLDGPWRTLLRLHGQTSLAIAIAATTPLQAGELVKLKLARQETGAGWSELGAAFALERVADVFALLMLGAIGFWGVASDRLLLAAGVAVLLVAASVYALRRISVLPDAIRLAPWLAQVAAYRVPPARMAMFVGGTATKWVCVLLTWQALFAACGIELTAGQCALLLSVVSLAVTASLVPGGLGVSEVSTKAVLTWMSVEPGLADAGAVLLRLMLPLVVAVALVNSLPLLAVRRSETRNE
jgi:hypothetical protein